MQENKSLKTLKEKSLNELNEFFNKLDPYNYDNNTWDLIKEKYSITLDRIESLDDENPSIKECVYDFTSFVRAEKTLKSEKLTARENFIRNITEIGDKMLHGIAYVFNKIKFAFAIPAITFAASIFTYFISLLFSTFFTWIFPFAYTDAYDGVVNAIIACVLFLIVRIAIFKDVYLNQPKTNIKTYLISHFIAISFWWFIFYFIRYQEIDNIFSIPVMESVIYLPYLPVSAFTNEYFITPLITYFVLNIIPFVYILIYIFFMEKYFEKRNKYKKDSDIRIQEDYDYHFDINQEVILGNKIDEEVDKKENDE